MPKSNSNLETSWIWRTKRKILTVALLLCQCQNALVAAQECSGLDFDAFFLITAPILSADVDKVIATYDDVAGIESVEVSEFTGSKLYLSARIVGGSQLAISTTADFENYALKETIPMLFGIMEFKCSDGTSRELPVRVPIVEENLYEPSFSQPLYEFQLPLPLPKDFDISCGSDGEPIVAVDYDLVFNNVVFGIEDNPNFYIETFPGETPKHFVAKIKTKTTVTKLDENITLRITATDNGEDPKTDTAELRILGNPEIPYIEPPQFQQSLYRSSYEVQLGTFPAIQVNLIPNTFDDTTKYALDDGDDAQLFTITAATGSGGASISLRSGATIPDEKTFLSMVITASRTGAELEGRAAIIVELQRSIPVEPSFEQTVYGGTVDDKKVITLENGIRLKADTAAGDVTIALVGEDAKYFRTSRTDTSVALLVSDELTDAVLKEKFYFHFTVEARKEDVGTGVAFVVLEVSRQDQIIPKFEQLYYEGTVTEMGELDLAEIQIVESTYVETLSFAYTGDMSLFSIGEDRNKVLITPNDITEEKLTGKVYVLVRITVTLEEEVVAETILIIRVVRSTVVIPAFEHNFLQGQLTAATEELTEIKVVLVPESFTQHTIITVQDSRNLFELKATDLFNEFLVVLKEGVSIPDDSHLTILLEATNPKSLTVSCLVLVEVIHPLLVTPEFEQLLYQGQINTNHQLEELVLGLKAGTFDSTVVFTLSDHDADLFVPRKLETNKLSITLNETVSEDDLANRASLQFNVYAKMGDSLEGSVPVVVIIQSADVKPPMFEKALYKSRIGTNLQLVPFEKIKITDDSFAEGLQVEIILNSTDLFQVVLNEQILAVSLVREVTADDLNGLARFEFVVQVSNAAVGSGFTTILVDIERDVIVVPEFTAVSYTGSLLEVSMEMSFPERIILKDGTATEAVAYQLLGADAGMIDRVINEDGSLKLSLKEEITAENLQEKYQLNFVVQANNPGSPDALASVTVEIIRPVVPVFSMPSFAGVLLEGQLIVNFAQNEIKLKDGTIQEDILLIPTEDDYELFQVTRQTEIQVSLKSTVNWNQIRNRPFLSFRLEASNPGSAKAYATIFITIENKLVATPEFTKVLYRGSLQKTTNEITFAASEIITLEDDSITDSLSFRVIEGDAELFNVTRDGNKFRVALKESVSEQDYEGRDLLSFQIEANNEFGSTDSTTVIIDIQLDEIISPQFVKAIYEGSIAEGSTTISLSEEITLREGTFSSATQVGLVDGDSDWFTVLRSDSSVTVSVKSAATIEWEQIVTRNYLSFVVQASSPGSTVVDAFVVLSIYRTAIVSPKFKALSFQGYLEDGQKQVSFPEGKAIELEEGSLVLGYTSELLDNDYQLFDHVVEDNRVVVSLKDGINAEDLENKLYLQFSVAISNPGSEKTVAAVVVDLKRDTIPAKIPMFEKTIYEATINTDYSLSLVDSIFVTEGTYTDDVLLRIVESNSNLFKIVQNSRQADIQLAKEVTAEDLEGLESLHLTIQAVSEVAWSNCFLYVSLPAGENEICTPSPPVIDCTDCYDCSTGEPLDDAPHFPYGNYHFHVKSDSSGMIGVVKASVKDPSITLEHKVEISDAYLQPRITLSTDGILHIMEPLLPNQYNFLVVAISPNSQKQTTVNVNLDVTQDQECPADPEAPKVVTVDKILLIESLAEETTHSSIFPSQLADCDYELIDEKPFLGFNYFSIDSTTHWLVAKPFDRENTTLFQDMSAPQFQLRLRLICPLQETHSVKSSIKRSLIETDGLNFARDITVINIIVVDINDNDPSFVTPPGGQNLHLGFPVPSIAAGLLVPHLFIVEATDPDENLNAKIRYSLNTEDDFGIDPEKGTIFPLQNAMNSDELVSLEAIATDRDGASDGRSTRVILFIHRLQEDNLVLLTATGLADVDSMISGINQNAGNIQLKSLMEARVPAIDQFADSRSTSSKQQENTIIRAIVYAFDRENNLQDSDTIKRIIQSSALSESITSESYQEAGCSGSSGGNCSPLYGSDDANTGLIAATSVLGALLLLSTGFIVFLYLRFVRPTRSTPANPSDIVQLENDFDISPPPSPPTLGLKKAADDSLSDDDRKISIQISGITDQESEDSKIPDRLVRSLESQLERVNENNTVSSRATLDESTQEPKNVKFNELVERIEVVEHHNASAPDGDDDSIYSERF
ncbi:uncharacterized protein LOC129724007 [Wyeomyia smithii]|uniref:uncharacterized protein LOC129724007 n=1 Tax=Wyeomyia smithii TaxID=174621 RepID=UPI002467E634|nr:uncharacterized protein LOC129724007 [Wyeomyia smithii]